MALGCSDGSGPSDDSGDIAVTVTMEGEGLDPDGFDVFVDGEEAGTLAGAGSLVLRNVTAGPHEVALKQVAPFCQGFGTRTADVVAGATADVTFALECIAGPGGTLVFVASPVGSATGLGELTALDMVTGQTTLLAEDLANTDLSADGSKLAYIRNRSGDDPAAWDVVIADPDASDPVTIAELTMPALELAWSPDGAALVFVGDRDDVLDLFVIDATGVNLRPVFETPQPFFRRAPDWSVTGRLAYEAADPPGNAPIWTADLDGSNAAQLTPAGRAHAAAWSPDGSQLAFMTLVEGFQRLHVIDADGGDPRILTTVVGSYELTPLWSHDGEWIAYVAVSGLTGPPATRLMAVRRTGGPVLLLNDDYRDFFVTPTGWAAGD